MTKNIFSGIKGKVVFITGAAAGIGLALSEAFAKQGAKVFMLDMNADGLGAAVKDLSEYDVYPYKASVTEEVEVIEAFAQCQKVFGPVDILFNNAGISLNKPSLEISMTEWKRCIDINLTSLFLCAQEAAKQMQVTGKGTIINMSSIWGVSTSALRTAYCTTKAGVVSMTKCLAAEWGSLGIRVLAIGPGYTNTALVAELSATHQLDINDLKKRTPLGRLAEPQEITELALFLSSDAAKFITGQVYLIDGGWEANGYQ